MQDIVLETVFLGQHWGAVPVKLSKNILKKIDSLKLTDETQHQKEIYRNFVVVALETIFQD